MLKLIYLEWKKNRIIKYMRNALILLAILSFFLFATCYLGIANDADTGVPDAAPGTFNVSSQVELLTNLSFLIFTCVMFSTFIVRAYKNKTMNLMFSYPIKRQKILYSKMLAVWIFNFFALTITKIFIYGMIYGFSRIMPSDFPLDYKMLSLQFYLQIILKSAVTVSVAFIALYAGTFFKSSKTTIIAGFLLFILMNGTVGDFSLAKNALLPVIMTAISLLCACLSVLHIEKKDVI